MAGEAEALSRPRAPVARSLLRRRPRRRAAASRPRVPRRAATLDPRAPLRDRRRAATSSGPPALLGAPLHARPGVSAHLDVKPRNIIMSSTPKLIDLSVALRIDDARRSTSPIGTDAYMAPEQCDPARFGQIGPPADSWGLGVTLYEALAARAAVSRTATRSRVPAGALPAARDRAGAARRGRAPAASRDRARLPRGRPSLSVRLPAEISEALEPLVALLPLPRLGRFRPGSRRLPTPAPAL